MKKVISIISILVVSLLVLPPAFAQRIYRTSEPPGRTAAYYIQGIIGLAGGMVDVSTERKGDIYRYRITDIRTFPPGITLKLDQLNSLIDEVVNNAKLRTEEAIRDFI
ncbi:MAG: hypothetical protein NC834_06435, partial [Candidatus Omnitrophica bacterium]|nr:hypothetical protein [Candidatus Omnitrophota bacterium]